MNHMSVLKDIELNLYLLGNSYKYLNSETKKNILFF